MRMYLALFVARLAGLAINVLKLGAGSTWPGHVALYIDPNVVSHIIKHSALTTILVAGTNGKSTTSSMIRTQLEHLGNIVIYNEQGANLLNGVASSLIRTFTLKKSDKKTYCVFEVDENALPGVMDQTRPQALVLLNLFRDQLDRYGEVNTIAKRWKKTIEKHPQTTVIANAHDPLLYSLVHKHSLTILYGVDASLLTQRALGHDIDSVHCPICSQPLHYKHIAYSHIGIYRCEACGFEPKHVETYRAQHFDTYPLLGLYNKYNTHAAIATCVHITGKSVQKLHSLLLTHFTAMFGRQEVVQYKGRRIMIILSKNPAGFNQSWNAITQIVDSKKVAIMLLLNDRIPDGRDVSWIWDVELTELSRVDTLVLGGDRAQDLAIRVAYEMDKPPHISAQKQGTKLNRNVFVCEELTHALETFIEQSAPNAQLFILPTYSAMLEIRTLLVGSQFKTHETSR